MHIAIASEFSCGLSWWLRLVAEGNKVAVWNKNRENANVGKGLVPLADSWPKLFDWAKKSQLSGIPTMVLFDSSGLGQFADEARKWGLPVIGGGKFCDRLEKDRTFGFQIAEAAGAQIPPHEEFESIAEALEHARTMPDQPTYFKSDKYLDSDATYGADEAQDMVNYLEYVVRKYGPDGKCILQDKIEGVPISTALWWNGRAFVGPVMSTIEHKKLMNDDVGPSTGCAINAAWFYEGFPYIAEALGFHRLGGLFLQYQAPPGIYDINAVGTAAGEAYFLEWTPRLGYDSEMTAALLYGNLTDFLTKVCFGLGEPTPSTADLAYAVHLGTPPYPWEHGNPSDTKHCIGVYVSGEVGDLYSGPFLGYQLMRDDETGLTMATAQGAVGLTAGRGRSLKTLETGAIEAAKALKVPGLTYRTDGFKTLSKDAKTLEAAGFEMHPGMVK